MKPDSSDRTNEIPMRPAFEQSARLYDAIYAARGKDYAREVRYLADVIRAPNHPDAGPRTLLDVACGTGQHLLHFKDDQGFDCTGVDRCPAMLDIARMKLPSVPFHRADLTAFNLGIRFDVVTCLFASLAYLPGEAALHRAVKRLASHLAPGGMLLIEPGVMPDTFRPPERDETVVEVGHETIRRITTARREHDELVITFEFQRIEPAPPLRFRETHRVRLFARSSYEAALSGAGLECSFDPIGPAGRGLFSARSSPD